MIFQSDLHALPDVLMMGRVGQRMGHRGHQHNHDRHILILVREGDMHFEIGGTTYPLAPGDWLLSVHGSSYRWHTREGCSYAFIHFQLDGECQPTAQAERYLPTDPSALPYELPRGDHKLSLPITGHLLGEQEKIWTMLTECDIRRYQLTDSSKLWIDLRFAEMLLLLSRRPGSPASHPAALSQMLRLIHENYNQDISVASLSEHFGLSRQYVMRLFQKHLHTTVTHYITQVRMGHALELLRHSNFRVGEVAEMLGYHSDYYFCRVFKQTFGQSPSAMRKMMEA